MDKPAPHREAPQEGTHPDAAADVSRPPCAESGSPAQPCQVPARRWSRWARPTSARWDPDYRKSVRSCLHTMLVEKWEPLRLALRDLVALLEQAGCGTSGPTSGLLGYVDGEPAGWVAVDPRKNYPRILARQK